MAKVFISYAREDRDEARRIYEDLLRLGHDPWLDLECLLPGQKWQAAIESAIRDSHFFVALLSPYSVQKRGYVQKELRSALEVLDTVPETHVFLIPVRLAECEPTHDRLRELQWLNLFPHREDGIRQLERVLDFAPKATLVSSVADTTWESMGDPDGPWIFTLRSDGIVEYDQAGGHYTNGTWRQAGGEIYMTFNEQYAQYRGTIDGDCMHGDAQSVSGKKWKWIAEKRAD